MEAFGMDSSGRPVAPGSESSHYARHGLSRRAFIGGPAAAAAGPSLGSGLLWPAAGSAAAHSNRAPKPTTNAVTINGVTFHFTGFGRGMDPSSITDFKGLVGVADVRGKGTARNRDGSVETLLFDTDMRFMKGVYIGQVGADATTGVTLHDRSTCPVNPLRAVMVMVAVADPPATTEAGVRADDAIE
jgi:hypothetical protein